ncbi:hypothetical protein EPN16_02875 [bacterium]|nr:MAG: hypothetical protein EPN16_02875 [bacterium]
MKKNTFFFLAACSIIIAVIILLNVSTKTGENSQPVPLDNMAPQAEARDLTLSIQGESAGREIEREPAIPEGEPLLN